MNIKNTELVGVLQVPFADAWVHFRFLLVAVLLIVLDFFVVFFVLFVFILCHVYSMLPVSLDCSFLIAPSVFSVVYLKLCIVS